MLSSDEPIHWLIRYGHLPDNVSYAEPGAVRLDGEKLYMHLPAGDKGGMKMEGIRMNAGSGALSEYLLIFHEGILYLERLAAVFCKMRSVEGGRTCGPPPVISTAEMEEWSPPSADYIVSPVTPEDDHPPRDTLASKRPAASRRASDAKIGAKGGIKKKSSPGIRANASPAAKRRAGSPVRQRTASKSIANKALPRSKRRAANEDDSDSGSDSGSSSSSSSGGSSGSDSSDNSDHFTDASSDEE